MAWDLTIERSIAFEDEVEVVGRVLDADPDVVETAYEFRRAATDDVCIRADLVYGCFDGGGERTSFPAEALEVISGAEAVSPSERRGPSRRTTTPSSLEDRTPGPPLVTALERHCGDAPAAGITEEPGSPNYRDRNLLPSFP